MDAAPALPALHAIGRISARIAWTKRHGRAGPLFGEEGPKTHVGKVVAEQVHPAPFIARSGSRREVAGAPHVQDGLRCRLAALQAKRMPWNAHPCLQTRPCRSHVDVGIPVGQQMLATPSWAIVI